MLYSLRIDEKVQSGEIITKNWNTVKIRIADIQNAKPFK